MPALPGSVVTTVSDLAPLRPVLPPEIWANRDLLFYDGMHLEIESPFRDYTPAKVYTEATQRFEGQAKLGAAGSLEGYIAGQPFPVEEIDCRRDPQAGVKYAWDFDARWQGAGQQGRFRFTYWHRGEQLPLVYEGTFLQALLSHRVEAKRLDEQGGDLFRGEKRKFLFQLVLTGPPESRGVASLTYRYKSSDAPLAEEKSDDTWTYIPSLRRVRRMSEAVESHGISGTPFTFEDLQGFSGLVPRYSWECLGEVTILAPVNTRVKAYPYVEDHYFGPLGLSYADDRWELRRAVKLRMTPRAPEHPYSHKDLYVDRQTLTPLYAAAYDRDGRLWKIIWHNHRWSGDGHDEDPSYYPGWEGVSEPRDLKLVSDAIIDVQTASGTRIEYWDNQGTELAPGQIRRHAVPPLNCLVEGTRVATDRGAMSSNACGPAPCYERTTWFGGRSLWPASKTFANPPRARWL
jgi:hypothetical protein